MIFLGRDSFVHSVEPYASEIVNNIIEIYTTTRLKQNRTRYWRNIYVYTIQ